MFYLYTTFLITDHLQQMCIENLEVGNIMANVEDSITAS